MPVYRNSSQRPDRDQLKTGKGTIVTVHLPTLKILKKPVKQPIFSHALTILNLIKYRYLIKNGGEKMIKKVLLISALVIALAGGSAFGVLRMVTLPPLYGEPQSTQIESKPTADTNISDTDNIPGRKFKWSRRLTGSQGTRSWRRS